MPLLFVAACPQDFREPLYLTDKPVVYQDTRTEEERRYPQLFRWGGVGGREGRGGEGRGQQLARSTQQLLVGSEQSSVRPAGLFAC